MKRDYDKKLPISVDKYYTINYPRNKNIPNTFTLFSHLRTILHRISDMDQIYHLNLCN